MSFSKLRVQERFEDISGIKKGVNIREVDLKNFILDKSSAFLFLNDVRADSSDFYFKGLISLLEGINNAQKGRYSWSTIKLYYSVYYFLRSSLACKNIAMIRNQRDLYYFRTKENEKLIKTKDNRDHKGTMLLFKDLFKTSDKLQTNEIFDENMVGKQTYDWLIEKREEINYKDREFHEPNPPFFWNEISEYVVNKNFFGLIDLYLNNLAYCFQAEHACFAIPLQRFMLTKQDLYEEGFVNLLNNDKKQYIDDLIHNDYGDNEIIKSLIYN